MDIRPIRSDADHRAALREVERLWDPPGSPEGERLEVLARIRTISAAWHLPIALLAAPYRLEHDAA